MKQKLYIFLLRFKASGSVPALIDFQTDYLASLGKECGYDQHMDYSKSFHKFVADKVANLCKLRDCIYVSHMTETESITQKI